MERVNVMIAGGGIVGSALAMCLAKRGVCDIQVVDLDLSGLYASSELNAGGVRATWWQPINIETCRMTLDFFRSRRDLFGFSESGYLWLYDDPVRFAMAKARQPLQHDEGLDVQLVTRDEVEDRYPILDRNLDELVGATWSPGDGLINPNAVRSYYRKEAEALGVRFSNRHYVDGVVTERIPGLTGLRRVRAVDVIEVDGLDPMDESGWLREILTTHRVATDYRVRETRVSCEVVLNCLGAWSPIFSAKLGLRDVTEAIRRQICLVDVHREDFSPNVEPSETPMIVDASDLYFHPDGDQFLAGYSIPEEAPGFDFDYDGEEFFEEFIWPRLAHRASGFERCGHVRGWSGLYAVTPDCSGIAGPVPGIANLFEAHSFTGRGVMQSFGIGSALSERIVEGRYGPCDLSPLGRERFESRDRWLPESLHI
ncbi:MAG: FAD-binding oxidoreductase [Proteobacteria bacterium]|nr:FAD-binding oxidoreductase [Pseudomonadota bacterium]